jgi:hypothetical protein
MNGATTEPVEKNTRNPMRKRKMIMGVSHHFLRVLRKPHSSLNNSIFAISHPLTHQ